MYWLFVNQRISLRLENKIISTTPYNGRVARKSVPKFRKKTKSIIRLALYSPIFRNVEYI